MSYVLAPLGVSFKPKSLVKKAGSVAQTAGKTAVKVAAAPYIFAYKKVMALLPRLANTLCAVPQTIVQIGANSAGVDAKYVPLFCQAIKINDTAQIKKLLPPVLKIAVKVAASGSAPGVNQALSIIRNVPGVKLVPGLSFLAGSDDFGAAEGGPSTGVLVGALAGIALGTVWLSKR